MKRRPKPAKKKAPVRRTLTRRTPAPSAKSRALAEAHAQQRATGEILRVIASSPADLQRVLDTVVHSAARLCECLDAAIFRVDGDGLRIVAHDGTIPPVQPVGSLIPSGPGLVNGRAIRDGRTIHVPDLQAAADEFPEGSAQARRLGWRATLAVPLRREGTVVGTIAVRRVEARPFSDSQIALLETLADQAVIAIENARLLRELQDKNADLSDTLARQAATGEVLRAISRAHVDAQPVFDIIAASALRLCGGGLSAVVLYDGALIHLVALANVTPEGAEAIRRDFPRPADASSGNGRVLLSRAIIQIPDVLEDPAYALQGQARVAGIRSYLGAPMLRDGTPVGVIAVTRPEPGLFQDELVELLRTFADQAVIAIENARLFTALQASNRELSTALDTQTATSDILRVISRAQTNAQPVFQAIVDSAQRLLGGNSSVMSRLVEDRIVLAAYTHAGVTADALLESFFPIPLHPAQPDSRPIRDGVIGGRVPYNVADTETDPRVGERGRTNARARGYRSQLVVPMLRQDEAIGTIAVTRAEPGAFTDDEIALLQTFADQAVIAIENARLLNELQARTADLTRSVGELRALGEIGQAIGSTLDLQTVLATIVARATPLAGADAGVIYEYDAERELFEPRATEHLEAEILQTLVVTPVRKGQGATGRLAEVREPIQVPDVRAVSAQVPVRDALIRAGYRALLAVPLMREEQLIGGLTIFRKTPGDYPPNVVELMRTFATQSALAIQNARLFREIEIKSRELEVASQHKSEFLASMSHELRTPLNAIIGFSDVLLQGMFGETNEKQTEYLRDILASGQHLLSLINDILDLSKIEAGRMDLEVAAFDLPSAIDDALLLMRERAERRGIALERQLAEGLGEVHADQRKVKQVLLNLLSNAVKFTPEGGRIDVRAALANGTAEISVTDTGIGIAPEDHEAVFEEFRQVGTADKKAEGTGLGLALCRKFVELHGGRIWVSSQLGAGSTFTFSLPLGRE